MKKRKFKPKSKKTLLHSALQYGKKGWGVFPCKRDKRPYIKEWQHKATTNQKKIKAWWLHHPSASIGIVCGKQSNLVVIDIDKQSGGIKSFKDLKKQHNKILTLKCRTGGGGVHYYFEYPPDCEVRNSAGLIADGVDVRGEGGYIIAPPSKHPSGMTYSWLNHKNISSLPNWLLKASTKEKRTDRQKDPITEGKRNTTMTEIAGTFRGGLGWDFEKIASNLLEFNELLCVPPLEKTEILQIAKSVSKYATQEQMNDVGNARRFAKQQTGKLLWAYLWKRWLAWDGRCWDTLIGEAMAGQAAKKVVQSIYKEAALENDDDKQAELAKWGAKSHSGYCIGQMLRLAKDEDGIKAFPKDFDTNDYLFNCLNGTIDLSTGILHPHNPQDKITKVAPVEYPADIGERAQVNYHKMKLWNHCLEQWMRSNENEIKYLQRLAGYCLTGDRSKRVFPVFHGGGRNGKSSFLDTLSGLMGSYAGKVAETLLKQTLYDQHPTEKADLEGKRLAVASETKSNMKLKTSLVKEMTGDQTMKGRAMRQDFHEFKVTHKVVLMTQNLPVIDEITDAIWDRVHLVKWGYRVKTSEQDVQLLEKLKAEWPWILAWAVKGWLDCPQGVMLEPTETIRKATERYRRQENPIGEFLKQYCKKVKGEYLPFSRLWKYYKEWETSNKNQRSVSKQEMGRCLTQLGFRGSIKSIKGKSSKVRWGLTIKGRR